MDDASDLMFCFSLSLFLLACLLIACLGLVRGAQGRMYDERMRKYRKGRESLR
jgi:hypothetical protein